MECVGQNCFKILFCTFVIVGTHDTEMVGETRLIFRCTAEFKPSLIPTKECHVDCIGPVNFVVKPVNFV